jgi:hypothetical protein
MMKCLGAVMALLVLLLGSPANAANELGLFFGEYPGIRPPASLYEPVAPFTPIRAHLVLYGPTMPQLAGWACSVGLQGTAYLLDVTIYHGGVNAGDRLHLWRRQRGRPDQRNGHELLGSC